MLACTQRLLLNSLYRGDLACISPHVAARDDHGACHGVFSSVFLRMCPTLPKHVINMGETTNVICRAGFF